MSEEPTSPPPSIHGVYVPPGEISDPPRVRAWRLGTFAVVAIAGLGATLGLAMLWFHLTTDPLADVRAYYNAATRLNHGQPLYLANGDPTRPTFYFYPPLLAIAMRPFAAVMPFHVFALGWEAVVVASFVGLLRRLGANRRAFVALGLLGMPIGWALGVGQAHVPMTLLMIIGQPWSIALAANIKIFPLLIALWWLGRREYQAVGALLGWLLMLGLLQVLVAPHDTLDFFTAIGLGQVGGVQNLSPYAISPILWVILVAVGAVGTFFLAPTNWGWPAAVALSTLASPRLLVYMLMSLIAAVREPDRANPDHALPDPVPDAAEAYVGSAR